VRRLRSWGVALVVALGSLAIPPAASAKHGNADDASRNMFHVAQVSRGGTNSDLAFWVNLAAAGNYNGFRLLDIRDPENPVPLSTVTCRGPQGDVSFYEAKERLLLIVSVDTPQTVPGPPPGEQNCESMDTFEAVGFEGLRIWDVTDPYHPKFVRFVRTDCGSHTHTTIPDKDDQRGIVYVSSYPLAATGIGPRCGQPNPANLKPHGKISIVQIPDADPAAADVLKEEPLHHDTDAAPDPPPGIPVDDDIPLGGAVGCHDITVLTEANQSPEANPRPRKELAAAACLSEGQIWDISDPADPKLVEENGHSHMRNESVEFWHSSAWTYDGEVVLFGDEHGGGSAPGCGGSQDPTGNMWFYRGVEPPAEPPLLGRYHVPRPEAPEECSIHNFNVVPVNDNKAYIGVSSVYKAGTTVVDFSAAKEAETYEGPTAFAPLVGREVGYYEAHLQGPGEDGGDADTWSTYWYNDYIWANDGLGRSTPPKNRGFDVFKILLPPGEGFPTSQSALIEPPLNAHQFRARKFHHLNPQTQEVFSAMGG
jgi:hypothetical protein